MSVEPLPDPDGLRDKADGKVTHAADAQEMERCALARAEAILTRQGAELRAALYGPATIASLAIGTVGLMLAKILNGEIEIRDAKQAAEIAKIALTIHGTVDQAADTVADEKSPAGRAEKMARADELVAAIRARVAADRDRDAPDTVAGAVDLDEFDFGDDPVTPHLRSVPSPA